MHPGPAVRARGIVKSLRSGSSSPFGAVIPLDGVDIDIAEGHVHGLGAARRRRGLRRRARPVSRADRPAEPR